MDDLLSEFLTETNESIATLDVELVTLEQNPDSPGLINEIFRLVHTIKGTCGFLGLPRLESVAHSGENVLGKFREGTLEVTSDGVSLILDAMDRIKEILDHLEKTGAEPEGSDQDLINALDDFAVNGGATAASAERPNQADLEETVAAAREEVAVQPAASDAKANDEIVFADAEPEPVADSQSDDPLYDAALGRTLKEGEVPLDELERIFQETESSVDIPDPKANAQAEPVAVDNSAKDKAKDKAATAGETDENGAPVVRQSIRVGVDLLEGLMTMVSELVLTRNQLLQLVRGMEDSEFSVPLQRLSNITTELQEGVMKTRMQPIGNAWAKLPRIVRDLGKEINKKINLEMIGAETELDRQVLELIKDPLTHMVRNSADHGLEPTADRAGVGKPDVGTIVLNAYHEGGQIIIEVSDDGRGIDVEKVGQKALANGLTTESELEQMSDQQIQNFIFKAGFSTAENVTNISGRGVGMDVVRTNIEKIGGVIDLKSRPGKGSTFTIKIPLTLAIVSALIVESANERFAIPQLSVVELVRTSNQENGHRIEKIHETPVLRLRDRLLPLIHLNQALGLAQPVSADDEQAAAAAEENDNVVNLSDHRDPDEGKFVVVTQVGNFNFGIVVDGVFDTEEIVVKPVAPILRDISVFSGNTILGDGSVIMILDPNGIASTSTVTHNTEEDGDIHTHAKTTANDGTSMLIFRAGGGEPKAVPLSLIARLEELPVENIERTNGQLVVQYRENLMPLVKMDPNMELSPEGRQPVLVFADGERTMGLVVDEIVDIVDEQLNIELEPVPDQGSVGSAVLLGKATEIIDVVHYIEQAFGGWFGQGGGFEKEKQSASVLLIDDSPFFRHMMVPLLRSAGYEVTEADDAAQALALREDGEKFDVIVSDIEMPGMSGFDFAANVRSDLRWQQTPIVALSSHTTIRDFDRGRDAGFTDYVAKLDRESLLETLSQTVATAISGGRK